MYRDPYQCVSHISFFRSPYMVWKSDQFHWCFWCLGSCVWDAGWPTLRWCVCCASGGCSCIAYRIVGGTFYCGLQPPHLEEHGPCEFLLAFEGLCALLGVWTFYFEQIPNRWDPANGETFINSMDSILKKLIHFTWRLLYIIILYMCNLVKIHSILISQCCTRYSQIAFFVQM